MSTPRPFDGRSLICPIEAFTTKSLPRYLLIVFALAGDSTTTRFLAITRQFRSGTDEGSMTEGCFHAKFRRVLGGLENSTNCRRKAKLTVRGRRKAPCLLWILRRSHNPKGLGRK